ncbi:MAG: lysine 2,3-aminomutase [Desulfuromonas sp.]|nr:MAG: lysine 2,3-aminomutase [Desulfuromonas sp.]
MDPWQKQLMDGVVDCSRIAERFGLDVRELQLIADRYPLRLTQHLCELIEHRDDPIGRQFLPNLAELRDDPDTMIDPLAEADHSPVPGVVHRHPDRALLLVNGSCPAYCRFCFRKGRVGTGDLKTSFSELEQACDYFAGCRELQEVILTGGEPLLLTDLLLENLLARLRRIDHVGLLRIHTRMPVMLPDRMTDHLVELLRRVQPLYLVIHVNHPRELAPQMLEGCRRLAESGVPLASQTVLLKGVNDDVATLENLFRSLLRNRIRPYYLHQADLARGAGHFRTPLAVGQRLLGELQGRLPGLALPQLVVDLPGGKGKVPAHTVSPGRSASGRVRFVAPDGCPVDYPDLAT